MSSGRRRHAGPGHDVVDSVQLVPGGDMAVETAVTVETERRPERSKRARPGAPTIVRSPRVLLLIALSGSAGVIHAKAMIDHASHYWLFGVLFGVLTYAQVLWAVRLYKRPDDESLFTATIVMNVGVIAVWIISRTVGLPFGPWAHEAEPFGVADIAASIDELVLIWLLLAMMRPDRWLAARLLWLEGDNCKRVRTMIYAFSFFAVVFGKHKHPAPR